MGLLILISIIRVLNSPTVVTDSLNERDLKGPALKNGVVNIPLRIWSV